MEKVVGILLLIGSTIFFLYMGLLGVFFQDKAWEIDKKRKRAAGIVNVERTKEWERMTKFAGIGALIFAIFFFSLTIFVFIFP